MKIDHLAIWCNDIEAMRIFYITYFDCINNKKYYNQKNNYSSYFLTFPKGNCRLELMHRPDIKEEPFNRGFSKGIAHFDIEVGNEEVVDIMAQKFKTDGYSIVSEPRRTGDGYYEFAVLDPEGNYLEISAKY